MSSTMGESGQNLYPPDVNLGPLGAWRQSLDTSAQAYALEVQQAVRSSLGAVARFDSGWQLICRDALAGRSAEMHALRQSFLGSYEHCLQALHEARELARFAQQVTQRALPEELELANEAKMLATKLKRLSDRWQSADDLEDLAAESIAPSDEKLQAVRRQYGYPQAWYDDDRQPS